MAQPLPSADSEIEETRPPAQDAIREMAGSWSSGWRLVSLLAVGSILAACASLPPATPRERTFALPAADVGPPAERVRESLPDPSYSGFQFLPTPEFALDARVALSRQARQSLDLQYYVIHDDATGRDVLRQVVDAARR
jgi:putative cardiolipin synthase